MNAGETASTRREHAVARSMDPARLRAEKRVQRFLDAALELMNKDSGREITVQEVVERSGQSLRTFYHYFAGKHELLLALFEESIRSTAEQLRNLIAEEDDAPARLRRFTVEYYLLCPPPGGGRSPRTLTPAMAEFAQRLLTEHPKEASRGFRPLVSLLEEILDDAAASGHVRSGLHHRRIVGILLQATMFNAFAATISGSPVSTEGGEAAEELWDLILLGIGAGTAARSASRARSAAL